MRSRAAGAIERLDRGGIRAFAWILAAAALTLPTVGAASEQHAVRQHVRNVESDSGMAVRGAALDAASTSGRFVDPTGDVAAGGMDITNVIVSYDRGRLSFVIDIPSHETLPVPKYIAIGLDSDVNARTGNAGGIDYRLWVNGSQSTIELDRWSGTTWTEVAESSIVATYSRGLTVGINASAFGSPENFDFVMETYRENGSTLEDAAPDQGRWHFVLTCFGSEATGVATDGPDVLIGTPGNETIDGLGGDDKICGGAGTDTLIGGLGNDPIDGGPDLDGISGGPGDDRLVGGTGVDLLAYVDSAVGVHVNLSSGTATGAGTDSISGFEAVAGSSAADLLEGDALANFFFPLGGDDVIRGGAGFDFLIFTVRVKVSLAAGRSTGEGNDRFSGIEGLFGSGELTGDGRGNFLMGGPGNDIIEGGGGDDSLIGLAGRDRLTGGPGADLVEGGAGDDLLDGGAGAGDIVSYINSPVRVNVNLLSVARGEGVDRLNGFESVVGSQLGDVLTGSAGPDDLQGKGGNDRINGGAGNDLLDGGGGRDRLAGDAGDDYCFDGERASGCEGTGRSLGGARAARAVRRSSLFSPSTRLNEVLTPLLRLGGAGGLEPLLTHTVAQVRATPSDRVVWRPKPTCASRGDGYVSKVWPPAHIQPSGGGEQTALWYAELRNQRGRVLPGTRTPDLEAVVVGPSGVPSGHTQEWRNARTGQLYRPSPEPIKRTATYFWVAEIRIEETGEILSRISVPPPCPRKAGS